MPIQTYRDLIVWQKSMELVVAVYQLTTLLPKDELYGLSSQMKRAVVSIPSNIAEGFRRNHQAEKTQFFAIAYASGAELETQLEICTKLGLLTPEHTKLANQLLDEIMRMLNKLSSLK